MKVLITGCAGFIGFHLCKKLLQMNIKVYGIDNINDYYDTNLKDSRLSQLLAYERFSFSKIDITNNEVLDKYFFEKNFTHVINLAAQAGVRYSLTNPRTYIDSNISGFLNILECCRHNNIEHLIYASSSSVYGSNEKLPFSTRDNIDNPKSLYAASKKSNELMAHTYSHLFGLPTTGLRFFTVYGPWGRPDMALFIFTKAILESKPIDVFNNGNMKRDFTYVDDITDAIAKLISKPPMGDKNFDFKSPTPNLSTSRYQIFNIGNNNPVNLEDFITTIEKATGKKAIKNYLPMQQGDVKATFADIDDLKDYVNFYPKTDLEEGINNFVNWYREFYKI